MRWSTPRCTGEDLDGPKTVEEKVARLAKVRLLKQFSFGVIAYVLATALVVLLPIFVSPEVRAQLGRAMGLPYSTSRAACHVL